MPAVAVLTPEQLRALVVDAVREALAERRDEEPAAWLTTNAAAALLGLHPKTVARFARTGELPGQRLGAVWRFERAALLAWMANHPA